MIARDEKLPNGATVRYATYWNTFYKPHWRLVMCKWCDRWVTWDEYDRCDGSPPYTCHGHYFAGFQEAYQDMLKRLPLHSSFCSSGREDISCPRCFMLHGAEVYLKRLCQAYKFLRWTERRSANHA
jgi:hypothetical protein